MTTLSAYQGRRKACLPLSTEGTIRAAIQKKRKIVFQYFEYTPKKEKARKHDGYQYRFGPYAMIWNRDCCYAVGWSEKHGKIAQFRVDRTTAVELLEQAAVQTPDFDPAEYVRKVFGMYLDDLCTVELLCDNEVMRGRIDRFGETVQTETVGEIIPGWCSLGGKPTLFKTRCEKKEVVEELKTQFCEMAQQYKKVMTPDMRKKISERYNK